MAAKNSDHTRRHIKKHFMHKAKVNRSHAGNAAVFIGVLMLGAFMALPFVYAVGSAFKPLNELFLYPPRLLPQNPTFENFKSLWALMKSSWVPMSRYIFNTVLITVVGTVGQIIISSMCAFPLAKHPFPGNKFIFRIIFLSLMFHASATAIPTYIIMAKLHMLDTYWALILPACAGSFGLYLMKQFIEQINNAILEAAEIDGAGIWQVYMKVVMPMVKPAWLTLAVFSVQSLWNLGTSTYIYSEELKTFSYATSQIVAGGVARTGTGMAVAVIMMLVPIAVYIFTQSSVMQTMASSGVKE